MTNMYSVSAIGFDSVAQTQKDEKVPHHTHHAILHLKFNLKWLKVEFTGFYYHSDA